MIQGKYLLYNDDLTEVFQIRRNVFVIEKGLQEDRVFNEADIMAIHAAVYDSKLLMKAVATGRLLYDGTICRIDQLAVLKEYRGQYYGDFIVRMLLDRAFRADIKEVILDTEEACTEFFRKIGFHTTGESSDEDGIKYFRMIIQAPDIIKICRH
jgi:predicted GNAT family N-acyltransferase